MQALVLLLGSAGGAALAPSASSLRPVIYASVRAAPEISSRALRMRGGGKQGDTPVRWRALGAEAIGTGMITGLGTGVASAATYCAAQSGLWQIAAATGAAVTLSVYTTAAISGAHLNPAVTIALAAYRSFPRAHIAAYIAAQCAGASIGALLNYLCFARAISAFEAARGLVRGTPAALASAPGCLFFHLGPGLITNVVGASALEGLAMAVLTFVILVVTDARSAAPPAAAPALIGLTLAALISVFGPLTAAGVNPARDIGPRIVASALGWGSPAFTGCWAYVLGPVAGALLGGAVYRVLYPRDDSSE